MLLTQKCLKVIHTYTFGRHFQLALKMHISIYACILLMTVWCLRDRNASNIDITWQLAPVHDRTSLPVCISERTPPAPSRTPHNLPTAALQRTWPPLTSQHHHLTITVRTSPGFFIHYRIFLDFLRLFPSKPWIWLICPGFPWGAHCIMYRQMDDDKMLSGFWIRNQIDFAGVSNAVYFTREVASYCVAHERHMRSISITARRTSGGLRDVWRDYPMVNVQEVRVVLFLSDECKHNSSNTDFTEPLTFTESTRR